MTITFYNWTVLPSIFTGIYGCFSVEFFNIAGSDLLQKETTTFSPWPPRSPDLTPWDFFLWGFVKDRVYVPQLPMSLKELGDRITHAMQTITADMLHRVWDKFDYRLDVCRVTEGACTGLLWLIRNLDICRCWRCKLCQCKVRNKFLVKFETAPFFSVYTVYTTCI